MVKRCEMTEHIRSCQFGIASCEHCRGRFMKSKMNDHKEVCELCPVPCTNNCSSRRVPRKDIESHLQNSCPLEKIRCVYHNKAKCGRTCNGQIIRKDKETHRTEPGNMVAALEYLLCKVEKQGELIKRMRPADQDDQYFVPEGFKRSRA